MGQANLSFRLTRKDLFKPLQMVCNVVERKNILPALSHVVIALCEDEIRLTATDTEIELMTWIKIPHESSGEIAVPARKLLDICKNFPDETDFFILQEDLRVTLKAARSKFMLATIPVNEFPKIAHEAFGQTISLQSKTLKNLILKSAFSMAQQDTRSYLNGMLWEWRQEMMRVVATDGHRLAFAGSPWEDEMKTLHGQQMILPRKGILELSRLLADDDTTVTIAFGGHHIRISTDALWFTIRLIDGVFPNYEQVIPQEGMTPVLIHRHDFKQALSRVSILSSDKSRGVRLSFSSEVLMIEAASEQDEALEELPIHYEGPPMVVGFNAGYLLDVLDAINDDEILMFPSDGTSSCLMRGRNEQHTRYVVMPMKL